MTSFKSVSAKQKTAADKFGNTNFKRVGPNTAKNRQKDKKKSNVPYQGHGGHRMDLEQVRKLDQGNVNTLTVAIGKDTYQRIKSDARVQSTNAVRTVRNYTLTKYGIEAGKKWAVKDGVVE